MVVPHVTDTGLRRWLDRSSPQEIAKAMACVTPPQVSDVTPAQLRMAMATLQDPDKLRPVLEVLLANPAALEAVAFTEDMVRQAAPLVTQGMREVAQEMQGAKAVLVGGLDVYTLRKAISEGLALTPPSTVPSTASSSFAVGEMMDTMQSIH
eukprot:Sspe_Gene.46105::Locus_22951_Transcript_1_2_Confidence_0.800_Length_651::g.46105::m.46105